MGVLDVIEQEELCKTRQDMTRQDNLYLYHTYDRLYLKLSIQIDTKFGVLAI